jgi:phospholipid transport system substrate-binding protein
MAQYIKQNKLVPVVLMVFLPILLFGSGIFAATNAGPMEQLQKSVDELLRILQSQELQAPDKKTERKQLIDNATNEIFDFQEMARSSLGQTWDTLTSEEQDQFVGLFTRLIEQRYKGKLDAYDNQKIIYKKELIKDKKALIYTVVVDKDLEIPIDYRLRENQGKWLVYDLRIENVSLIVNYRRDFDSIIRKEQFAGLVEKISKQLEKSDTSN